METAVIRGIIIRSITILSIFFLLSGCHHSSGGHNSTVTSESTDLTNLVLSSGTLSPQFDVDTTSYTAQVANNILAVTATITTADSKSTITVNGAAESSGKASQAINLSAGANTLTIVVTAQDGTTKTYTVVITRLASNSANLTALSLSTGGALSPVFTADTTGYTAQVDNSVSSITITPTAADSTSTITVNGQAVSSGAASQAISLLAGANTITIVVTAQDKTTKKTYAVVISRLSATTSANLAGLTLSTGSALSPVFAPNTTGYTAQVAYNISSITITPKAADSTSTITVNGQAVSSGAASQSINLAVGANTITIVVTAQDKITTKIYAVVMSRLAAGNNANLAVLSITGGTLSPVFAPNTTGYTALIPYDNSSIQITPTAADSTSAITVNGQAVRSGAASQLINLSVGTNTITIVVTAQDKITTRTYAVVATRFAVSHNPNLAGLGLSTGGVLSPAFAPNTTSYTGQVPDNILSITITPTAADPTSSIAVNGQAVSSGAVSQPINLSLVKAIIIVVTAQDGTKKTYTVNIERIRAFLWVTGDNMMNQSGVYSGAASANNPGARDSSVSWIEIDSSGNSRNLWLFGGYGYDGTGNRGYLNDLWKFDSTYWTWTWVSGDNIVNQSGVYNGAASANKPGSRWGSVSWRDSSGNLWLFGGYGYDGAQTLGYLNDLWKFDGINWTWISGSNAVKQYGVYGTKGVAGGVPGGRASSVSWRDNSGNLWIFGGWGYDGTGNSGDLNDLWKFDGTNWTWVSGSSSYNQSGVYGVSKGTTGVPGGRDKSVSWIDSSGKLWLFGGNGFDAAGIVQGLLNDLWVFNGLNWTWVSGDNIRNQVGVYSGVASANKPGARWGSVGWIDKNGLWLFGGSGYDGSVNENGYLNDLWKFDGINWTWVSGSNKVNQSGVYGDPASLNIPGGRASSVSWIDSSGNLWFFGGFGKDSTGSPSGYLNDLWQYK